MQTRPRHLISVFCFAAAVAVSGCHSTKTTVRTPPPPAPSIAEPAKLEELQKRIEAAQTELAKSQEQLSKSLALAPARATEAQTFEIQGYQDKLSHAQDELSQAQMQLSEAQAHLVPPPPAPHGSPDNTGPSRSAPGADSSKTPVRRTPASGRAPLADYIPCRFTDDQEAALLQGFTPEAPQNPADASAENFASTIAPEKGKKFLTLYYRNHGQSTKSIVDEAMKTNVIDADDGAAAMKALQAGAASAPTDVSCSQSMMSWNETDQIFGRAIADRYVAFQVNVRNLNPSQQFLVHDIQVAVVDECLILPRANSAATAGDNSGIGGTDNIGNKRKKTKKGSVLADLSCKSHDMLATTSQSHFLSGRDRKLVQGLAERGQQTNPRNLSVRLLEAVGSIFGAAATATGGPSFSDAVHVFNAAFIPGFKSAFPDFTIAQLARLGDMAFSADSAYKLVIGVKGSAPVVTFVSSDIFAERFRQWTASEMREFQRQSVVVIAGAHIIETNAASQISKLSCPQTGAYLDYSAAKDGKLTCTVTGTSLDKVSTLILRSAVDSNDVTHADATVTPNADKTSASADFTLSDLQSLTSSTYTVFTVDASGTEKASSFTLSLPPVITKIDTAATPLSMATCKPCRFKLTGTNLDVVSAANLVTADTNHTVLSALTMDSSASPTSRIATLSKADAAALKVTTPTSYQLQLVVKDKKIIADAKVQVTK